MIINYQIKRINNEEVLILYFSNSDIFYKNYKDRDRYLKNIIKKYIIDNKIVFAGTIVSLVVGSTLISNLNINNNIVLDKIDNYAYVEPFFNNEVNLKKDEVVPIQDEIIEKINESINKEKVNNNIKIEEKKTIKNEVKNNIKKETKVDEVKEEKVKDDLTYVKIKRSNGNIETIELEEYLVGVVSSEMPAEFNIEALKAQSVIARTYALKAISKGITLTDNESTQSYNDNSELKKLWGSKYDTYLKKISDAVKSTKGKYLTYKGELIEAVYHSTSNGQTENASNVWGNNYPYLISVNSEYDSLNPTYITEKELLYDEISNKLNMDVNNNTNIEILEYTESGRVKSLKVNDIIFKGTDFRLKLGLKSTDFKIELLDNGIKFTTTGYGHGVGMSQYGANGMAKNGYNYIDILMHYYPNTTLN